MDARSAVTLSWADGPQSATVDGTEVEAQSRSRLRTVQQRFDRYTSAVRYVDVPALFENRPELPATGCRWADGAGTMRFGLSAYFDKLDVSEAIGHEYARTVHSPPLIAARVAA